MTSLPGFLVAKSLHEADQQRRDLERLIAILHGQRVAYAAERRERLETELLLAEQRLARIHMLLRKLRQEVSQAEETPPEAG